MDKLDLVVQRIEDLKESTNERLDRYNDLLEVHIKRTNILEKRADKSEERIEVLEEPKKVRDYLASGIVKISGISGAIYGIIKLIEHIRG